MDKEFCFDAIVRIPDEMTNDAFDDSFIEFIESNNWYCGGGVGPINDENDISMCFGVSVEDELTYDVFYSKLIAFFESHTVTYNCDVKEVIDGYYINEDGSRGAHVISEDYEENESKRKLRKTIAIVSAIALILAVLLGTVTIGMLKEDTDGEKLQNEGLVEKDFLTNAELMLLIAEMNGEKEESEKFKGESTFDDVHLGEWFYPYVAYAEDRAWIINDGDGNFNPQGRIDEQMMSLIMLRQLGYSTTEKSAIEEAMALGIYEEAKGTYLTKGEAFVWMWETVNTPKKDAKIPMGVELGTIEDEGVE